ncbi:UNVERIFIED_CONTAM: hypothetical protein Sindi_0102500 [Sesamum indicum]
MVYLDAAKCYKISWSTFYGHGHHIGDSAHLHTLYAARVVTSIQWKGDLHQALAMDFCFRPVVPRAPRVVRWSTPLWRGSSLIQIGTRLGTPGRQQQQALFGMQLDRMWEVQHLIMHIVQLQQELVSDVQHVFREANGAVDHLQKDDASRQLTRVIYKEDITGVLRSIIRLDKLGTPYLRR